MSLAAASFLILVAAFLVGAVTNINAGLIAIVATFGVGLLLTDLDTDTIVGVFPADLFFILVGATLLFSIVRVTGTIDMLAAWAERLTAGRRTLVPVIMFALTALLATAGAFTPAAVAIVAPVALALGRRFGISTLAMGLVIVQGANAGAFSPVNPFGVVANEMLDAAGAADGSLQLYLYCFAFNAFLAVVGYAAVQAWTVRRRAKRGGPAADDHPVVDDPGLSGGGTAVATRAEPVAAAEVTPMRLTVLGGVAALLLLTLVLDLDVGVSALVISLALIALRPSIQKPAIEGLPWSAVLLVTGIVMYVGLLKEIGAIDALGNAIEGAGASSTATLATSYVVGVLSAFASTTGTLGAISPVVVPLAADPALGAISVITTIAIASSVVDVSPMSTSGALLLASAEPKNEKPFFRMLLIWAIAMIAVVPGLAWLVFVQLGIG
ncbi:TRAP transporter large permease subunit [Saccharopolyspora hirsuta]|uniref:TRAP transporter large permease subunit n=1 Tax=Saccharopolyspora hirsuta TaxID=1837 RepID=A0A5M7C7M3_SACHI|nr:SLC13 family permease [Saccharopolyspora hirsuta]KAA5837992.1 TRAP transporter large permease subunit [Saccharopolyspora hirsuta]